MPFHDQDWEDLQRDCDIFPAYTDFIYGPDERLVVTQEPGLHPAIYYMNLPPPVRYTNSMPSRSWSYKTAEQLEMLEPAAMREPQNGNYGFANAYVTGTRSGSTTPGLDVRSQTSSPLYPLLPPQGVRTVHEKEIAQRSMSNASQRRPQPGSAIRFSPSQQQQPVRLTRQQTQMRNALVYQQPVGQQQNSSFLRSSSTTDIDENLAQMNSRHQPTVLSPFTSPTPMLPPPIMLPQQQPHSATGLPESSTPIPASNNFSNSSKRVPLLRPNDILHDPRYNFLHPDKRMEIAKLLHENEAVARDSQDNALRAKAFLNIRNATLIVNQSIASMQAAMELQTQRSRQLQMQETFQAQANQVHQNQQPQFQPQAHQVYAQPPLQPGITPVQSSPSSPDPYYTIPHTPQQQMSPLQPPASQGYQVSYPQDSTPIPNPTPPQLSVQLRAKINRHLLQVWQCLRVVLCTLVNPSEEAAHNKERAGRWIEQFKASLPVEGRPYLMQVISRMIKEHNAGGDVMALLGVPSRPA
ncbi:hypothetical protein J4E91_009828 [Alternaria rosae]|nr:hypothetical protein J4E91_009828 [Alternaria rosae]